jgi:YVTN family beta-propeller protein
MRHAMVVAILCVAAIGSLQGQDGPYHAGKEIPIGGEGGWDYLTVDAPAHRLYVSHATHVVVIDTQANKIVGDIPDTPGVHGFAIAADLGRGFTTNGRENKASIVDLKTLNLIQKVDTGENPDAVLYEPVRKEVYTMNGRGKSATVIDAATGRVIATIPLEGKPEFAQADSTAGRVYVNIEDKNAVQVIATATHTVGATWPVAPCEAATGMAFDAERHRLFLGCDNKLMVMLDSTTGKVVHSVPVGAGVDSTWFDPATKLAFTSNGESGTVTIAHEESASALKVVQTLKTVKGARTMALDPATHTIYLAATDYEPQPAASKARPKPIGGTFRILTYEMNRVAHALFAQLPRDRRGRPAEARLAQELTPPHRLRTHGRVHKSRCVGSDAGGPRAPHLRASIEPRDIPQSGARGRAAAAGDPRGGHQNSRPVAEPLD